MGVVYKAEDPHLDRAVALKAMLPGLGASAEARQRFLREAKAAAAVKHDYVVTIYQVGEDRGVPFLTMEFLEGEPLDHRLQREEKLPIAEVVRIGREVAEGLSAAHEHGLIHRDIKPANIWLEEVSGRVGSGEWSPSPGVATPGRAIATPGLTTHHSPLTAHHRPRVKILDFGLARGGGKGQEQLTHAGAILGTPAFMAPEQARGETVDARCDLFSLGCVLYRMCTGELPFKGNDPISTLMAVATVDPQPLQTLNPSVPPELIKLIERLLAKDPARRPSTARSVADELAALERAIPAVKKNVPPGKGRKIRLIRALAIASAAIVFVGALAAIATWSVPKLLAAWERSQIAAREAEEQVAREAQSRLQQEHARVAAEREAQEANERAERAAQEAKVRAATNQTALPLTESIWGPSGSVAAGWADAGCQAVQQGSVRVQVSSVRWDAGRILIHLRIENTDGKPGVTLHGWGIQQRAGAGPNFVEAAARLMDHASVRWDLIPSAPDRLLPGQSGQKANISPNRPITDLLVFNVQSKRPEFLRLELPAVRFGGNGQLRLQIPKAMLLLQAPRIWRHEAVGEVLSFLKGTRQPLRISAANALGQLGADAATATPALIAALKDPDGTMRVAACDALGKIGTEAREAYVPILNAVADRDETVRTAAVSALTLVAPPTSSDVPELLKLFTDRASPLRIRAAVALRRIKPDAREALPALIEALQDADPDVARAAVTTLRDFGKPPVAQTQALGAALKSRTAEVRAYALTVLEQLGEKAVAAAPALSEAIRDSDAAHRKRAARVLRKVDPTAEIPAFAAALKDANEEVRMEAVTALAAAGSRSRSVILDLLTATRDTNALVRVKAARLLYKIDSSGSNPLPTFRDALKEKDARVRREAADGLTEMGSEAADAAKDLSVVLRDSDNGVRLRVAAALNKCGTKDKHLVSILIRALEEEALHKDVAPVLIRMEADAVPALVTALDDKRPVVRFAAVTILGKIGPAAKDAYAPLLSLYRKDPVVKIRGAANTALGRIRAK
jgi:HEAT repeat protein